MVLTGGVGKPRKSVSSVGKIFGCGHLVEREQGSVLMNVLVSGGLKIYEGRIAHCGRKELKEIVSNAVKNFGIEHLPSNHAQKSSAQRLPNRR